MGIRWEPRFLLRGAMAAILVLAVATGWLGWLLIAQDRALERQRTTERLEYAADLTVAELRRQLNATAGELAAIATSADPLTAAVDRLSLRAGDAVVVMLEGKAVRSSHPLPFYPDDSDRIDIVASPFAAAEAIELANRNVASALAIYQTLSKSPDVQIRAGAFIGLGRVAQRLDRNDIALAAYKELGGLGSVRAAGRAADLVAAIETCATLERGGPPAELHRVASDLEQNLRSGRWRLSRGEYYAYLERTRRWLGAAATQPSTIGEVLAGAIVRTTDWPDTWTTVSGAEMPVMLLARPIGDRVIALVVSQAYASRTWFREAADINVRQRAGFALTGSGGETWHGSPSSSGVRRNAEDVNLPFGISVATTELPGDEAGLAVRRWLWIGMFATLSLLLVAGGYVVLRSVSRELEVARLQSDFVAAVSHEFRTPVAAVRQLSEVLDEGRVADADRRSQYYKLLRRESGRLQRLVEGLLDFRRMESDAAEYRFEDLDPMEIVRDVTDEFHDAGRTPGSRVAASVEPGLPAVRADREAIGRALRNLIDNAVKYSPPDAPILVEAASASGSVIIRVRDHGPGIAPDEHRRIFDKFVRGTSATATGAQGTGLGLTMVAHIMRAHRGEVTIDSAPGAGATFSLVLPCGRPS